MPTRRGFAWLALALIAAAMAAGSGAESTDAATPDVLIGRDDVVPTFPVAPAGATLSTESTTPATEPGSPAQLPAAPVEAEPDVSPDVTPAIAVASITDPAGDATPGFAGAPPWAELLGATLSRLDESFELRIQLGASAPTSSGGSDHTLNVAAFVDVDGDGRIDYELWANLADGGWDVAWFDDRAGTGAYSDEAAMDVAVEGPDLVLRFPHDYVGSAAGFRWALASEYGSYATLGTPATARDEAPDAGGAATFPG